MLLKEYKNYFVQELTSVVDSEEANQFFYIGLEEILGFSRVDFLTKELELSKEQLLKWNNLLDVLKKHQPIQYYFKKAYFFGLEFMVSSDTLIPRSETEELVEWVIETCQHQDKKWRILDIGTGSGCIPITLAKNLSNVAISAIDFSEKALEIAQQNAQKHNINIQFIQQDILQTNHLEEYDIIISNPPYVRDLEKKEILPNVLAYEPHSALFVSDNKPLVFYEKITQLAFEYLKEDGFLFFEINQYLGLETQKMIEKRFCNVELRRDLKNNFRMIKAFDKRK